MGRTRGTKREPRQRLLGRTLADIERLAAAWQERAAIMQFDGGLDREEAEHLARLDVLGGHHGPDHSATKGVTQHWRPPKPDWPP